MPETEKPHSITAFNRRQALTAGIALASAAAVGPALAASADEGLANLAEARRLETLQREAAGQSACSRDDSPEQQHWDAVCDDALSALEELLDRIRSKPRRSLTDVAALAVIAGAFHSANLDNLDAEIADAEERGNNEELAALQLAAAVLELAEGQAHG